MGFTPLPRLQPDQLDAVLRPKVAGSWVLHQLTETLDLDHFVLFSSVAGLWGSRGMAHYTAANQFLDALAHHRRALGLPALAVNWGGWEGGDSSRDAARFLEQSDFRLLPVEPALAMLGSAMMEGVTQRAIAWVDWASLKASYELHAGRPFLREIEIADGESDAPEAGMSSEAATSLLQQLETLAEEEALSHLTSHVRGQVAEVLGLDPAQLMEPGQGFFKLGMDSLMTVELRGRLERSAGVRLPTTIAFEYPTVEALSGFLAGKLLQRYAAAQAAPSAADGQDGGVAELDLVALSEDELAAMLDGALADLLDDEVTTG
jgi:myxalamid-type polyketide synthase MxaE and MxaD